MAPKGNKKDKSGKRRRNAPSITVDTSAVNSPQQGHGKDQSDDSKHNSRRDTSGNTPEGHRDPNSESEQATLPGSGHPTPTSPHGHTSPTQHEGGNNYLSVPRSNDKRGSHDDNHDDNASTSGDTAIGSTASDTASTRKNSKSKGKQRDGGTQDIINDKDALKPDPGTEADFDVQDNKFAFSPGQLSKLLNPKNMAAFYHLGGLDGLEKGLRTDKEAGLSAEETTLDGRVTFEEAVHNERLRGTDGNDSRPSSSPNDSPAPFTDRKRVFSDNRLPEKKLKSFLQLAWIAYNDKVLILLTVAAAISLLLGIYQAVTAKGDEPRVQWIEGFAIVVAIVIVVVVGAVNDYQKELQFAKLNKKKEDRYVTVTRSGNAHDISIYDLLVGDVVHLTPGDIIPVDGIYISGHNVKCDESSATGESDLLYKTPAEEVFQAIEKNEDVSKLDPFILSGGKVSEGVGKFLVTATGTKSTYGKMLMSLQDEGQTTPLQSKLNVLADQIAKIGLSSGLILFTVLFIKYLFMLPTMADATEKGQNFLQIFIVSITIVVVSVPEGLPLAVTLALAFATTRMLKDNNLVRVLRACETMGNATTICSDKTGTLTQNEMTIVRGTIGTSARFGKPKDTRRYRDEEDDSDNGAAAEESASKCISKLSRSVKELLFQSTIFNSTAFENKDDRGQYILLRVFSG
ncbi:hypothetical protein KEM56_003044 [Ascosphaera pollenicola]|nr:hypothetical protein KEM56_003044 [Ascosphaera pollenicola]